MKVVLEAVNLPTEGVVKFDMHREFIIKVTAEEAQRKVSRWLWAEVSMLISADPATLAIGERVVWRVPTWIGFPSQGRAGTVGTVDIDVQTGEIYDLIETKRQIEACATEIAKKLPPYQPRAVPKEFIPKNVPPAPILQID